LVFVLESVFGMDPGVASLVFAAKAAYSKLETAHAYSSDVSMAGIFAE